MVEAARKSHSAGNEKCADDKDAHVSPPLIFVPNKSRAARTTNGDILNTYIKNDGSAFERNGRPTLNKADVELTNGKQCWTSVRSESGTHDAKQKASNQWADQRNPA